MDDKSELRIANNSKDDAKTEDKDFTIESSSEDDEDTIREQEEVEGNVDHEKELNDLEEENNMTIEELRKKYSNLPDVPKEESNVSLLDDSSESENEGVASNISTEEETDSDAEDRVGLKSLILDENMDSLNEGEEKKTDNNDLINDAAAIAESIQPKGNTLSSTSVSLLVIM